MVDTQSLLLPGVVAVVVGLSVLYLIYRLFVSSSSSSHKSGKKGKKQQPAKKKPSSGSSDAKPQQPAKRASKEPASSPKEERTEKPAPSAPAQESKKDVPQPTKKKGSRRKKVRDSAEEDNLSDFLPIIVTKDPTAESEKNDKPTKVTGKNKIAAAKEEPLAEGWEIVGLRKKEWKDLKKKEKDLEVERLKKEEEEKKEREKPEEDKEGKKGRKGDRPERREGGRERGQKGNRPFGDRKNRKGQGKKDDKVPASPQVSEKTKRREEIKINGILFSKYKDEEEEDEDWCLLSDIIDKCSSSSDDIAPLRTAHLELRYYTPSKDTPSPSPRKRQASAGETFSHEGWSSSAGELAKYNYTQGKTEEEIEKEKDEGSEVSTSRVWDLGEEQTAGLPDEKTSELIEAFIKALGHPFTSNLAPAKLSVKGKPQRFLIKTDVDSLRSRLLKRLSSGVSLEPPVCRSQSEAAEFVDKLLRYLDAPFVCYTNESQSADGTYSRGAKFWRKGFGDAGFFIVTPSMIVMIWFIGYD